MQPTRDEEAAAHRATDLAPISIETPVDDAAEQSMTADPVDDIDDVASDADAVTDAVIARGLEVGEWDAAEQARPAGRDDDYRP